MKRERNIKTFVLFFFASILFVACNKEGLTSYSGGNSVGFWIPSMNHSLYGMSNTELPRDTVILDIAISGYTANYDRKVDAEPVSDPVGTPSDKLKNTAIQGVHYNIIEGVIPAGQEYGKLKVEIINNDILQDGELKLNLALKANEDFSLGLYENRAIVITWSRAIMQPVTWSAMRFFFCADYSTQVYKIFMQVTGLKQFYYYEGEVSSEEGNVMGRNFANVVRQYEIDHGTPMLHDDGAKKGLPIVPLK